MRSKLTTLTKARKRFELRTANSVAGYVVGRNRRRSKKKEGKQFTRRNSICRLWRVIAGSHLPEDVGRRARNRASRRQAPFSPSNYSINSAISISILSILPSLKNVQMQYFLFWIRTTISFLTDGQYDSYNCLSFKCEKKLFQSLRLAKIYYCQRL